MAKLIAEGFHSTNQWERTLAPDQRLVLGRDSGAWAVPWDKFISHEHAELRWRNGQLEVQQLPSARNPIFKGGQAAASFCLKPGDHFVIGETRFRLVEERVSAGSDQQPLLAERAVSAQELQRLPFRDPAERLDVLCRLPDVISGAANDSDLFVRLVSMLLAGIPHAGAIGLVAVEQAGPDGGMVRVLHGEHRFAPSGKFHSSRALVREAVRRQETVLHIWGANRAPEAIAPFEPTEAANCDWAFCTPVRGQACKNWAIYVMGRLADDGTATVRSPWESNELRDDLKFTELVAAVLGSLRQVQQLQRHQAGLQHFFSPAVARTLADEDPEVVLKPRETEVVVLFCDLRGFSRQAEKSAGELLPLLERVSQALGLMTQNILDWGGVVGDFHGDAAMGFWGWPIPHADAVTRACMAALGIRTLFEAIARWPDHPLADFKAGVGIGTGRAVAGKIGSTDQVKITVFGPIVNLASRLEGMTKLLRTPILMDETTARLAKEQLAPNVARQRRLARVKPYGLDTPLVVSELLPPVSDYCPVPTDDHLAKYEAGLDAFMAGEWEKSLELLSQLPVNDCGRNVLSKFIYKLECTAPCGWQGVIELESK